MIYFLQEQNNQKGPIKIGYAERPESRLCEIQTGYPGKLVILHTMDGTRSDEAKEHMRWDHLRLHGEWFRAGLDLLLYIRAKPTHGAKSHTLEVHRTEGEAFDLLNEYWPEFAPYERTGKWKKCPRCWKHAWLFECRGRQGPLTVLVWDGWPPRSREFELNPVDVFMGRDRPWDDSVGCGYDEASSG